MKRGKVNAVRVMKYVSFAAVIAFVVILMLFMSASSRPFEEVKDGVAGALDTEELTEQDSARLKRDFGLTAADYAGVAYYSSGSNISASEVLLIRVKRDDQIRGILDAVQTRNESRKADFEDYLPEEAALLDHAAQSVRGAYVFYAVSPDADEYLDAFSSSL